MEIRELTEKSARREAVPILRQLWTDASPEDVMAWTGDDEYHLFGGFVGAELVAVAGVLTGNMLHHARHAWVYDLVVDEPHRNDGYGTALLEFVEEWAAEKDCAYVALASPLAKDDTHRYYQHREYEKWGYIIEKEL